VTTTLNLYEAKTQLSKLVERAAAGEEIVIAKAGKPMARLVPLAPHRERKSGFLKGKIWIADDFDETPEWLIRAFEEGEVFPPEDGEDKPEKP
jgi:prevent-host-death family protein